MKELDEILKSKRVSPNYTISYDDEIRQIKKLMLDTLKEVLGEEESPTTEFNRRKVNTMNVVQKVPNPMAIARNNVRQSALKKLEEKLAPPN